MFIFHRLLLLCFTSDINTRNWLDLKSIQSLFFFWIFMISFFLNKHLYVSCILGRVGKLSIKIPWKKLGWDPIIIVLEDVFISACQREDKEVTFYPTCGLIYFNLVIRLLTSFPWVFNKIWSVWWSQKQVNCSVKCIRELLLRFSLFTLFHLNGACLYSCYCLYTGNIF